MISLEVWFGLNKEVERGLEMSKHEHGSMNTEVQEKTFEAFMSVVTKTAVASILVLVFMALVNS